jgi:hypothetical protein
MEVLLLLVMGAINILCFLTGAKVGQAVSKGEPIETPTVNPVKAIKEHRARQEAEIEASRIESIMQNIENYDGTGFKQEDVPKR